VSGVGKMERRGGNGNLSRSFQQTPQRLAGLSNKKGEKKLTEKKKSPGTGISFPSPPSSHHPNSSASDPNTSPKFGYRVRDALSLPTVPTVQQHIFNNSKPALPVPL